jgi:NAD(P)-dependent dehydrogenase (short-subunit alcohol dehydrogenase family)
MRPILVTGAAKGLGAAICRALAAQGHDIVIHYRGSEKEALKVAEECRYYQVEAAVIQGDFATQEELESFIRRYLTTFPQTKGLVNNVGNYLIRPSIQTGVNQWRDLFQTNFFTPVFLTQALLPSLKEQKGCIVNIGVAGLHGHRALTKATAYAATKSALFFYTVSLAKEVAADGVRVNMLSPGFLENSVDLKDPAALPLKRPAYLFEAAHAVAQFFDPLSAYITGQNLEIAGGTAL